VQNPLTKVTLNVAQGTNGSYSLYEDNGTTTNRAQSVQTPILYRASAHAVTIGAAQGGFAGEVSRRTWTVRFFGAHAPSSATVDGRTVPSADLSWDPATSTVTVTAPRALRVDAPTVIAYRPR
jgi:Domain of unknown function (DUF5110)